MGRKRLEKEEFISRAKCILGFSCTFEKTEYIDSHEKVIVTCNKHGDFEIRPCDVLYRESGCPECAKTKISKSKAFTSQQFIKKAKLTNNCENIDFSLIEYKNNKTPCNFICKKHGVFSMKPYYFLLGHSCPKCNN